MGAAERVEEAPGLALRAYVGAFVDELARAGVTDLCMCPGSRSTPLALVFAQQSAIKLWIHLDERSASFFALGMAKAQRRPVALLCTSGTAAVNFAPAVAEAFYSSVPLVVLTADRPAELRDVGATQTIDQTRLYGSHVKWFQEMLLPETSPAALRHARTIADRAVALARAETPGPVHLNFPFREPLIPEISGSEPAWGARDGFAPVASVVEGRRELAPRDLEALSTQLRSVSRGLIVCGPQDAPDLPEAVTALAERLSWPLLADVLSQVRRGQHVNANVLDSFDAFLRDPSTVASLEPELILRFGATPVSKPVMQFLERDVGVPQIVVVEGTSWTDAQSSASQLVYAEPASLCASLRALLPDEDEAPERVEWLGAWREADATARRSLSESLEAADALSEPAVFHRLAALLPERAIVYAGNSMPVRDLDSFFGAGPQSQRFLCNRGTSGIDGVVSSALGVAAVSDAPVVLTIGDISFYHDMNGLLAARRFGLNATIIVINNGGGGIFSFLPQYDDPQHFETLFGTPHGLDFRLTAELYGLRYARPETPADFDAAVRHSLKAGGVNVIEVRTERDANLTTHRELWSRANAALRRT